jgi:hypothetical protein
MLRLLPLPGMPAATYAAVYGGFLMVSFHADFRTLFISFLLLRTSPLCDKPNNRQRQSSKNYHAQKPIPWFIGHYCDRYHGEKKENPQYPCPSRQPLKRPTAAHRTTQSHIAYLMSAFSARD